MVGAISLGATPDGLRDLALSSDGKRLFVTAPNLRFIGKSQIFVVNVDSADRPQNPNTNIQRWHEQIGVFEADQGVEGISATADPHSMIFTNRYSEATGVGVLKLTTDNPTTDLQGEIKYISLLLGVVNDYFDVKLSLPSSLAMVLMASSLALMALVLAVALKALMGCRRGVTSALLKTPSAPILS